MIVLDTNILSEIMKRSPGKAVTDWMIRQEAEELRTTAICQAEILAGITVLPDGKRKRDLKRGASDVFSNVLRGKVLPFDSDAALHFANVIALRRAAGLPIEAPDAMIAAIALAHGASVATRNIPDFTECGVVLHNPWDAST